MLSAAANLTLTLQQASIYAGLALHCIQREYPSKPDPVLNGASEACTPRALHPAFYGCFDWHSSVHGHWMLVRLLRCCPLVEQHRAIRAALNENLTAANLHAEASYFDTPNRLSFERTYGWAWLLKLAEELALWQDDDGRRWEHNLQPLKAVVIRRYLDFLPRQSFPIRTGVHPNTAFGLAFALDYARALVDSNLEGLIVERTLTYYLADVEYPASWEPGGEDFFSPALVEADLMRRVLAPIDYQRWFHGFLPGIRRGDPQSLLEPVAITDRCDPKLGHLDGLNLSRAWCMRNIARNLPESDPAQHFLIAAAARHAQAGLAHVTSGHYMGEHWLASFAVFLMTEP